MRITHTLSLLITLAGISDSAWAESPKRRGPDYSQTWCAATERIYFSCQIGKKTVSLCGSDQITKTEGYLQYRFGLISKEHELIFPSTQKHPRGQFQDDLSSSAQSFSYEIGFEREGYSYRIFIDTAARVESFGYGVSVGRAGEIARILKCTGHIYEDRAALWKVHDNQVIEHRQAESTLR